LSPQQGLLLTIQVIELKLAISESLDVIELGPNQSLIGRTTLIVIKQIQIGIASSWLRYGILKWLRSE
jgi:hypothetical protein